MRNSLKVAKWEVKRNMKNKSFLIGLFLTPLIIAVFMIVPALFTDHDDDDESVTVYIHDQLEIFQELKNIVEKNEFLAWELTETDLTVEEMEEKFLTEENSIFITLDEETLDASQIEVFLSEDIDEYLLAQLNIIEEPIKERQLQRYGFQEEDLELISKQINFDFNFVTDDSAVDEQITEETIMVGEEELLKRIIPGAFAGIILFSIVISGMMIFQSASQEKKEKIAEIILSSLSPNELMQGKIIGYFVLGIIQVTVWIGLALPVILWKFDFPIFQYLFVPELIVLLTIAILGYLFFASLFVGIGATIEDVSTSGNFQGLILMSPFIPFMLLGPVLVNPNGIVAKIASFIPVTSPGILIIRLTMIKDWPWLEIVLSILILLISVLLMAKLAGKIFKTGILMYGKNASLKEIWRWIRA